MSQAIPLETVQVNKPKKGLEYSLDISFDNKEVLKIQEQKLTSLQKKAKIDGFRKGKAPKNIIKHRYGESAYFEALQECLSQTYFSAIQNEKLNPVAYPQFNKINSGQNVKNVTYTAAFEVYPKIKIPKLNGLKLEQITINIAEQDKHDVISDLLKQKGVWNEITNTSKAKIGHKVNINFLGKIKGEEFAGGKADGFELELGSGRMVPGFEEGITGMKIGDKKTIKILFPKDYQATDLQGKKATFDIVLNKILEIKIPKLDKEIIKMFGIKSGSKQKLEEQITRHINLEAKNLTRKINQENVFASLLKFIKFAVPNAMIKQEAKQMHNNDIEHYRRQGMDFNEKSLNLNSYLEKAKERVQLGLIVQKIIQDQQIKTSQQDIDSYINEQAESYENPDEIKKWYKNHPDRVKEIKALILEDKLINFLYSQSKVKQVEKQFKELKLAK